MSNWHDTIEVRQELVDDGWLSPNSYSNYYAEAGDFPAVYLFQILDTETYRKGLVAYVGQSKGVRTRWSGHEVLRQIRSPGYWVKRWFRPTPPEFLDEKELHFIRHFDPPWNVQGRPRGVVLP